MVVRRTFVLILIWLPLMVLGAYIFLTFQPTGKLNNFGYNLTKDISSESKKLIQSKDLSAGRKLLENSKKILRRIPINDEALIFSVYGDYLLELGAFDSAILNAAFERNPRNRTILKLLLLEAQSREDIPDIVKISSLLYLLDRDTQGQYITILSNVYGYPHGKTIIDKYLDSGASWSFPLLNDKIKSVNLDGIEQLKTSIEIFLEKNSDEGWHKRSIIGSYARRLIFIGVPEKALSFWSKKFDVENEFNSSFPKTFNPSLKKLDIWGPFNWTLYNNKEVTTEFDNQGGLFATFKGNAPSIIARQHMPWSKNLDVQLEMQGNQNYNKNRGQFFIEIRCTNTHQLLANFDIVSLNTNGQIAKHDLSLEPHECDFIYIDIKAKPGIFNARISMTLDYLNIANKT